MSAFLNQTFDDRDTGHFVYQGSWFLTGSWNASNTGTSGTLASTNDLNANVTFTFPVPATAFYYYGIPRSNGGSYGICIDCDPNNRVFIPVDGFNATDNGGNPPIVLFSQTFSTPGVHELIIRNQADPRGTPAGNSQLTLDRIDLEVANPNAPATVTLSSSPTTSPTTTDTGSGSHTTTGAGVGGGAESKSSTPVGAIVGGVLGALALIITIVLFVYWLRLRRRNRELRATAELESAAAPHMRPNYVSGSGATYVDGSPPPTATTLSPARSHWGTTPTTATTSSGKSSQRAHQPMMPSVTSIATTNATATTSASASSSRPAGAGARRREQDAGPVPVPVAEEDEELDEEETLPPAYGQVFSVGRRGSRRSRRTLPAPPLPPPGKVPLGSMDEDAEGRS